MTLLSKLSALTGPDREVDLDLWWECKANRGSAKQPMPEDYRKSNLRMNDAPRYTASIDSAMTLVPEGWTVAHITQNDDKSWFAELREGFLTSYKRVAMSPIKTATPAIALCIAALKAKGIDNVG